MKKKKKSRASKRSKALKKQRAAVRAAAANKREADTNKKVAPKKADKPKKDIIKMPLSDLLKIAGVFAAAAVMLVVGLWAFKAAERHSILSQRNELSSAGIDRYLEADVNGVKQFVHVRGQNKNAPLLLIFPDYPGYLCASSDYLLGNELESYFTVVTWDMRGTGQTEVLNAKNGIDSTGFTYKDIANDAKGICEYIKEVLGRENDRFIVLGYSWGSAAAAEFVKQYPGFVSTYIGVSQISDFRQGISSGLMDNAQNMLGMGDIKMFNNYIDMVKLLNSEEGTISPDNIRKAAEMMGSSSQAPSLYDIEVSPYCSSKADSAFKSAYKRTDAYLRSIGEYGSVNFYGSFNTVKTHLIFGEYDLITPMSTAVNILESDEKVTCINGAGHALLFENSSETVGYIRKIIFGE